MAAYQQPPRDWFKLQELMWYGVDLYKVTLTVGDTSRQSVVAKEDLKEIYVVGFEGKLAEEKFLLSKELTGYLNYLLDDYEASFPTKRCESQLSSQDNGFDWRQAEKLWSERLAALRALPSVSSLEKEMVQRLHDVGILDSIGCPAKPWLTGKGKVEVKSVEVLAGDIVYKTSYVDGMNKTTGAVHNGGGTAETKGQETREAKARASNKSNLDKEKESSQRIPCCMHVRTCLNCGHQEVYSNTNSNAIYSKGGKKTEVEKEPNATEDSKFKKKGRAVEEFNAKQGLKTTEKQNSEKAAAVMVDDPNLGKGMGDLEVKDSSRPSNKKELKATVESDSRKKAVTMEDFNAKQELKTTEKQSSEKAGKIAVDGPGVGKEMGNQEEKGRPGSKDIHICKTIKPQEHYSNAMCSKAGKETNVEKELKAIKEYDCLGKNENSAVRKKSGRKQTGDVHDGGTAETESQGTKELKASASNKLSLKEQPSTKTISKVTNSKTGKETGAKKVLKATEESDSRKKGKAIKESNAREIAKANDESRSEKAAKVTVDGPNVGKGEGDQEGRESVRPGCKNVRTCMTCGLQEPSPKVFKKCKRCKDEGCPNPPYYCGRDCQVMDWTVRHRHEHEMSYIRDPTTS